jgi:hypothetical protein
MNKTILYIIIITMNIEPSFMANHIFTEKDNTHYGGDNMNTKVLAAAIPLSKLTSNTKIKAISHLGIPSGLINRPSNKNMTGGGTIHSIQLKKDENANTHDPAVADTLFSLINT